MNLKNKTVLVTGGAVRIGRAICEELALRGCDVVIHYNRSSRRAARLAERLRRLGVRAFTVSGDLRTMKGCRSVIDEALSEAKRLDALINNAAVFHKQDLVSASETDVRAELEMNLLAPLWLTRAFAVRVGRGRILNVLDRRITSNERGLMPYMLSKKALADFTKLASLELAPRIIVNAVAPGPVLVSPSAREKKGILPLGKRPAMKDLVKAVVFLLECDSVTGQIVFVDGGQHLLGSEA